MKNLIKILADEIREDIREEKNLRKKLQIIELYLNNSSNISEEGHPHTLANKYWRKFENKPNYKNEVELEYLTYADDKSYIKLRNFPTIIEDSHYNPLDKHCLLNHTRKFYKN